MSNHYHCSLGQIEPKADHNDYKPFKNASEVTRFTGLPASLWLARRAELKLTVKERRAKRISSGEIDTILLLD